MAFIDILNDSVTKEKGGRHGGKGHEFQRYWALCHLLEIDLEKDDYLLLMEYIEDVAVVNSEDSPSEIMLYQIKKREGKTSRWTKASILKVSKGENKSILAKLHESKKIVKDQKNLIAFVSNAPVELTLSSGNDSTNLSEFLANQVDSAVLIQLKKSIAEELKCEESEIDFDTFKFVQSPLAMNDLQGHALGNVTRFLNKKYPNEFSRAVVLCEAIYSEIKVKATSTEIAEKFQDLKRIRGISKKQFSKMVELTLSRKSDSDIFERIIENLTLEGMPFVDRRKIEKASRRFIIDKASRRSLLSTLEMKIEDAMQMIPDSLVSSWDVANWIIEKVRTQDGSSDFSIFERDYLMAATLYWMNQ